MRIVSLVGASFCLAVQTAAAVSTATANLLTSRFAKAQELHSDKLKNGSYTPTFATTAYGVIEGLDDGVVRQFLGVPFASPPVGDLRWKAPIPPAPWGGVKVRTLTCHVPAGRIHTHTSDAPAPPSAEHDMVWRCLPTNRVLLGYPQRRVRRLPVPSYLHPKRKPHSTSRWLSHDALLVRWLLGVRSEWIPLV